MRIVVNTPAGNIGRVVTEQLLEAQEDMVIITPFSTAYKEGVKACKQKFSVHAIHVATGMSCRLLPSGK